MLDLGTEAVPAHADLVGVAASQRKRLSEVRREQAARGSVVAGRLLQRIDAERIAMTGSVEALRAAIEAEDDRLVEVHVDELRDLAYTLLDRSGEMPVLILDSLAERLPEMTDQPLARRLIAQGQTAVNRGRHRDGTDGEHEATRLAGRAARAA